MTKVGDYNALNSDVNNKTLSGDPKTAELQESIAKAVKSYDPNAEERDESLEFHETEAVGFCEMLTRFSDGCDKAMMYMGFIWSFLFGASMPGFCIVFGELVDDMGTMDPGGGKNPMKDNFVMMVYVAVLAFVSSALYISGFSVFSESVQYKLKIEYLSACLMKDAAFYDEQNPNEMASKINKEAAAVRRGCSEKIGNVTMSTSMFLLGFVAAFYFGWIYSLILLAGLPFIACVGILFGMSM